MDETNNPNNPGTPANPAGTDQTENIEKLNQLSATRLKSLQTELSVQQQIDKIFENNKTNVRQAISDTREYFDELNKQRKAVADLAVETNVLNTKYGLFREHLESDIKASKDLSDTLETRLNTALTQIASSKSKLIQLDKDETELKKILGDDLERENDLLEEQKKILKELEDSREKYAQAEYDPVQREEVSKGIEQQQEKLKKLGEKLKAINDLKAVNANRKFINEQTEINQELAKTIPQELALQNLLTLKKEKLVEVNKAAGGLADKLTGVTAQNNIFASSIIALSAGGDKFVKSFASGFIDSFMKPEAAMNRFFNFLNKNLIQSTFEFDKILSEVNKNTGGFRGEFEKIAFNKAGPFSASSISSLATYGVGIKELGASYTALANKINGFNRMSDEQRLLLSKNAATMENLGISAQSYADMTSKFMASIGKTADGAKESIDRLARDAIAAGRNVGEYAKEFEQLMPKIAAYGREATQVFKELNAFAGMTKGVMSAGDLMSFSEQFANWDSAAESVSKLNAALGGTSLNIADLMTADPTERLMQIKRAFTESQVDFDKLNAGYKKLLAEAFGGDVSKAASFFKGSLAEANIEMNKMAATEKELEERKKKSIAAQEKLTKAIETMKIAFTPIIDLVAMFAEGISKISDIFGGFGTFLMVGLPLGFIAVSGMLTMLGTTIGATFTGIFTGIGARLTGLIGQLGVANAEAATLATTSAAASAAGATTAATGGLGAGTAIASAAGGGGLLARGAGFLGKGLGAIKNVGSKVPGGWGKIIAVGATLAASSFAANKMKEYASENKEDSSRNNITPSDTDRSSANSVSSPSTGKPIESSNISSAQALNSSNTNTQSVVAMNNVAEKFIKVSEKNSQNYAERISNASKEAKTSSTDSTREMFSQFSKTLEVQMQQQNNRPIIVEGLVASLDQSSVRQMVDMSNAAQYSKTS